MKDRSWQEEFADQNIHENVYNSKNPLVRYAQNKRLNEIVKMAKKINPKKVLEVGSGDGFLLERLYESKIKAKLFGLEISKKRIKRAESKDIPIKQIQGDAVRIPIKEKSFDLVIATEVVEHIENYWEMLRELRRITKTNGSIIITFPNETILTLGRLFTFRFPIKFPDHIHSFSPKSFNAIFGIPVEEKTIPALPFCLSLVYLARYENK